jgi:hypothetical protein
MLYFDSAPSATFAALINPIIIATLVLFNGAFIPYAQMQVFWKYWLCMCYTSIVLTAKALADHFVILRLYQSFHLLNGRDVSLPTVGSRGSLLGRRT